jgi:hypothetical protein
MHLLIVVLSWLLLAAGVVLAWWIARHLSTGERVPRRTAEDVDEVHRDVYLDALLERRR